MGKFIYAMIIVFSLVLQSSVFSMWTFLRVTPDLLLIFTVLFGLLNGSKFGAKFGFVSGFALDLLAGNFIGLQALIRMAIGFVVGLISARVFKENYVIPFFSVVLATILDTVLYMAGISFLHQSVPWALVFQQVLIPLCIYNGILCLLFYVRLFYFNKKIGYWDELFRRAR